MHDFDNTLWLQLLLPFTAVKNLYLFKKFAPGIAAATAVLACPQAGLGDITVYVMSIILDADRKSPKRNDVVPAKRLHTIIPARSLRAPTLPWSCGPWRALPFDSISSTGTAPAIRLYVHRALHEMGGTKAKV
jgi:hypothetical protein